MSYLLIFYQRPHYSFFDVPVLNVVNVPGKMVNSDDAVVQPDLGYYA
jgi:hypothetical protein